MIRVGLVIVLFLVAGALLIISNDDLKLSDSRELLTFARLYYIWLGQLIGAAIDVTGNVVSSAWLPETNSTLSQ